jgi:hypothetical protein
VQDKLEGVAKERVNAFSRGGGVVARLHGDGEPVSHILANLSIHQRKQVGVGTRQCKMQKYENYSVANFGVRNLYQDPCRPKTVAVNQHWFLSGFISSIFGQCRCGSGSRCRVLFDDKKLKRKIIYS